MIDTAGLLKSLQRLEKELEDDLRTRVTPDAAASPQEQEVAAELDAKLRTQYREARDAGRTGQAFEVWRDEFLTQVAVAWILGCVFVRFMEDNGLIETPRLSGPGDRRQYALDQHTLYFQDPERRTHSDREYLLDVFEQTQKLPAACELFDAKHNPLWAVGLSGDGATKLLQFWQRLDPETGALDHDFTDPEWNTRFLGDLYQDLSESARKKYALLQTPEFVEEFILDRTLTPAIEEFGFQEVRLIDPTCGSGHFLLGAFHRLFDLWVKQEPGANPRELVQRALDQVYGVDLNPFAVAIARFRLLVAALEACGVKRIADAPGFHLNLAAGDSLLHGKRFRAIAGVQQTLDPTEDPIRHVYEVEDAEALTKILGQQYQAVVGNPPYILAKDQALNESYRNKYPSCHGKYSLCVPFIERFFDLTLSDSPGPSPGFFGMIVANSFMRRTFGKKLIEAVLPSVDVTHVIDTAWADIPGHATATAILFGRGRLPALPTIRAVMGIRGEKAAHEQPDGPVWRSILDLLDRPGEEDEFITVADLDRRRLAKHPWTLGGGGASELKVVLDDARVRKLSDIVDSIGTQVNTGEDRLYVADARVFRRLGIPESSTIGLAEGEFIRDWTREAPHEVLFPYDKQTLETMLEREVEIFLWPYKASLSRRTMFRKTQEERGLSWFEYRMFISEKHRSPRSLVFAFLATHNHFLFDRSGSVFDASAPIIKLPPSASEDDHYVLLGLLNSSLACFWMKQVFYPKGSATADVSTEKGRPEARAYEFANRGMENFPIPSADLSELSEIGSLARKLDEMSQLLVAEDGSAVVDKWLATGGAKPFQNQVSEGAERSLSLKRKMIALQEELDWACYRAFGLSNLETCTERVINDLPELEENDRPFAWESDRQPREMLGWVGDALAERRRALEASRELRLIETPVFKRLWIGRQGVFGHSRRSFEDRVRDALRTAMLERLEHSPSWEAIRPQTCDQLADHLRRDQVFMRLGEEYTERSDFEVGPVVHELVSASSVPLLPTARFSPAGLRKRKSWEELWEQQREAERDDLEDSRSFGALPSIPKYRSGDYASTTYWGLRGPLDVPTEPFSSLPYAARPGDFSFLILLAGWDHSTKAQAIAGYFLEMKEQEGWVASDLVPLLLAVNQLSPWIRQWHNESDPLHGVRMGDYFEDFVNEEARALGLTIEQIESWTPPKKTRTAKPRKKAVRKKKTETEAKPA